MALDGKVPSGPLETKWSNYKSNMQLVAPANKRRYNVIVVGTGLAGAAAAASMGELGYNVQAFCFQDSPRRAHSIAAQGGINAAKNYQNDGDSVWRLFYDTIKGGDYRSREGNVHRLAELSVNIIDQCAAQGVPFAREYGGTLANRSFGGAQVSRTFYARGQTGQQLLLGAYSSLMRQSATGKVKLFPRHEMLELIVVDGATRGIVTRNLRTGAIESYLADAVCLATGGYGNVFYLSTNAKGSNVTAACGRTAKRLFCQPVYSTTDIPVTGDYQSAHVDDESLAVTACVSALKTGDKRSPDTIPEDERDYYLERKYPSFGNLVPRDVASRNAKQVCDDGRGVGPGGLGVYLDFNDAIERDGLNVIKEKYGNLFDMYSEITNEDAYKTPMRIYPAIHYTMGGLWVDYDLMSNLPGLFVLGEANFSDHGANRLGASALMQGLADGYFVIPYTIGGYLADAKLPKIDTDHAACKDAEREATERIEKMLAVKGKRTVDSIHKELGLMVWEKCGMSRDETGLKELLEQIPALREEFWRDVTVTGTAGSFNQVIERAGRVADFLEFAETMVLDALERRESCGGHFREESQTEDGEALRDDDNYSHVSAWEWKGESETPVMHKEALDFEFVHPSQRSYK